MESYFSKRKLSIFLFFLSVVMTTTFFLSTLYKSLFIPLPNQTQEVLIYSNQLNHSLKTLFIRALKSSISSIHLHTYAMTDETILSLLSNKTLIFKNISVITDNKTLPSSYEKLKKHLNWKGIKSSGLMHEKILLIDDNLTFLGTANMTYESLTMHDNLVLGFYHQELNQYLKKYTEEIDLKKKKKNQACHRFIFKDQTLELWMLPYKGDAPLDNLIHLINQSKKSLWISMFTLTHPKLLAALIEAHKRGVDVKVYLDKTSAKGSSFKASHHLLSSKIPLYISGGIQLLHHKMMLIDEKTFIIGSANWTKSAFKKNHDFYLILDPLNKNQKKTLVKIFKKIKQESKKSP